MQRDANAQQLDHRDRSVSRKEVLVLEKKDTKLGRCLLKKDTSSPKNLDLPEHHKQWEA